MTSDDEMLAELWREVRPNQLEVVDELAADVARVQAAPTDREAWQRIRATSHRLAGTLGTFGQRTAGEVAVALDRLVTGVPDPGPELVERAVSLVAALREELGDGTEDGPEVASGG